MKTAFLRSATFVLVLAGLAAAPKMALAQAQPQGQSNGIEEGRARFLRGIELYKEGNYHAALAEFRAAYAAAPSYRIHYNLGQTLFQLQDYAGAVRAFEQYLIEGGDKIEPERKARVESDLANLHNRVAFLTFVVNAPGADILIDDEPRGKAQKEPLLVSSGRRRITVGATGYVTETRVLDVAGTQRLEVKFELKPIALARSNVPLTRPKNRTPFYVSLVATGMLAAGTAVMAGVTVSRKRAYDKALAAPDNGASVQNSLDDTRTTALVADVLGAATIVGIGVTAAAFVATSGEEKIPTPTPAKATAFKPTVRPIIGPTAVGLHGTF